ncbi:hypothetical protein B9Z55_016515 [Caenorhabditis nigoni]|uniref:Serpentine receptor class r-10 n=1 Tax=Caenorhabditis nigoni TaxID=1611254 RepID=A0A2G5T5G6_9PELO|nr:hypothetical protein B9Z55_016515 [Caenorhabditis nigoni]
MMYQILHCIQFVSFIVSQFTNGFLLYLIWTKARKVLGAYSYLMATFSMYAIMYNYVDVITQPLVVIEKQMYVVVNHGPIRHVPVVGFIFTCLFGSSFGLCISLLSTQFFYRYLAVCRPKSLSYLEGRQFLLIFLPALFVSVTWFFFCYFGLDMTPEKQEMLKGPFMDYYGEDSKTMSFVSGLFWSETKNGVAHWNVKDCVGSLGLAGLMIICCSTIVVCAVKTYKKMNDAGNCLSDRTKELNRQLFITLSLQTLLPFMLMYGPVGLLFLFPLFQINIDLLSSSAAASTAIYPAVEPLIAIFCIKTFRKSLFCYKGRGKISSAAASTIRST